MPEFLSLLAPPDALARLLEYLPGQVQGETILVESALGRVTAEALLAPYSLPAFPRSTVDGYAVRAADTFGASESLPAYLWLIGEVPMGAEPAFPIQPVQAALIHTGGMLPAGADAVVMIEHVQAVREDEIEVLRACAVGENILKIGEDVSQGEVIIPAGTRLRPAEIGGLMALGLTRVLARRKPRVGIISTGDEVAPPDAPLKPGQVRDINSYSLGALVAQAGGEAVLYGIIPDDAAALAQAVRRALAETDALVITAGSSASTRDLTAEVIQQAGDPGVLVHGLNVKPGKPTILGVCDGKAVIGLPGNPVSALVIAGIFVTAVVERLLGVAPGQRQGRVTARLSLNLPSQAGREDWVPVRLIREGHGYRADPVFGKSNLIFSLARADGLARIPPDATGLPAGAEVEVIVM
jgi:molybdopterin molybdotransferase